MPGRKNLTDDPSEWTLKLQPGPDCSVGYSSNEAMNWDGTTSTGRSNEDRSYTCLHQDSIELYMVLDGHDGSRAVNFAHTNIPHFLLRSELTGGDTRVMDALRYAIIKTETEFFIGVDPHITRKVTLQFEIEQKAPEADSSIAARLFPTQIAEICRLDDLIKGGTTVVAALIYRNRLYVANVGDSRALLCSQDRDSNSITVRQLSVDHNTSNEDELRRLEGCGLDANELRRVKRLGMQQNTRSIGDYAIKGGYTNVDVISHAKREPGTAEPYLHEPINLSTFHGFLVLMSDGLYEAYEAWTGRPDMVNKDIAHLIVQELRGCGDLKLVAQKVVDKVKVLYRDTCKRDRRSGRLDDITLVIKNLGGLSVNSTLMRSQSTQVMANTPHPQSQAPPTAPITDKKFDFRTQSGQYPPYASPSHTQQRSDWSQPGLPGGQYPRSDAGGYYHYQYQPQPWPRGGESQPWPRGGVPPYYQDSQYHPMSPARPYSRPTSQTDMSYGSYVPYPGAGVPYPGYPGGPYPGGGGGGPPYPGGGGYPRGGGGGGGGGGPYPGGYPGGGGGGGGPYPGGSAVGGDNSYLPGTSHGNQPAPSLQQSHRPPDQNTTPQDNSKQGDHAPRPFTPPSTVPSVANAGGEEETPPPVPPRIRLGSSGSSSSVETAGSEKPTMSTISEADMYGWTQDGSDPSKKPTAVRGEPQGAHQEPPSLTHTPTPGGPPEQPDTLTDDRPTIQSPSPPPHIDAPTHGNDEEPSTLNEAPPNAEGGAEEDSPQEDFVYVDTDEDSSDEAEEGPDGSGTIKPYIRFNDRFPCDLSWKDITA